MKSGFCGFAFAAEHIGRHISNIFREKELDVKSNVQKMHVPNSDRPVEYYSLAVIIAVGYRVKSQRGTQFRQWATERLEEYMIKGFTLDDERLKGNGGGNYWKELLERIRDDRDDRSGQTDPGSVCFAKPGFGSER